MKKFIILLLTIAFIGQNNLAHARNEIVYDKTCLDCYDWELNDSSMRKTIIGMFTWGILLPIAISLLSCSINTSASGTTTSGS